MPAGRPVVIIKLRPGENRILKESEETVMVNRIVLNGISYHGSGAISAIVDEVKGCLLYTSRCV